MNSKESKFILIGMIEFNEGNLILNNHLNGGYMKFH